MSEYIKIKLPEGMTKNDILILLAGDVKTKQAETVKTFESEETVQDYVSTLSAEHIEPEVTTEVVDENTIYTVKHQETVDMTEEDIINAGRVVLSNTLLDLLGGKMKDKALADVSKKHEEEKQKVLTALNSEMAAIKEGGDIE